ncbi:unnamed protein product [Ambrosiozyma monospora]|uniref:Unnamed protein product n=1 Tax=Ambrosiozyma monospora TaxID=43982 RepID=A0ACB5ST99_AMBMO|nr:unnamed protein product [Ambrosiozyma monospora]
MGQLLSQPITEKNITLVQHDHISHSIGEMQGYRLNMEDAYCDLNDTLSISFRNPSSQNSTSNTSRLDQSGIGSGADSSTTGQDGDVKLESIVSNGHSTVTNSPQGQQRKIPVDQNVTISVKINIYGVFDGHGGTSTSRYVSVHLPTILRRKLSRAIAKLSDSDKLKLSEALKQSNAVNDNVILSLINFPKILKDTFFKVDSMFYRAPNNSSGSTAVVVLFFQDLLIVANSGDSRCIISSSKAATKQLSFDHKPKNLGELMRIHSDGGYVSSDRVNSILALSRAFGDFNFKMHNNNNNSNFRIAQSQSSLLKKAHIELTPPEEYQVTVEPDIITHKIKSTDEFLVIACDGIWDCYKPHDLVNVIRHELSLGRKLPEINELILDNCIGMANTITGIGFDNMTLIIVALHENIHGGLNGWYNHVKNKILDEKFGKLGH